MTIDEAIHKLDFSIRAYQKLIDENVSSGEVVGTGVSGTWTANTSMNKAYSDMIEAFKISLDTIHKYQKIEQILCNGFGKGVYAVFDEIIEVMQDGIPTGSTINPFFTVSGVNELAKYSIETIGHSDPYLQGMCNGIEYMRACLTDTEPHFITEVESEG